jgi:hypothetical protein
MINFRVYDVGTKVWSIMYGWGEIIAKCKTNPNFIDVYFPSLSDRGIKTYLYDGRKDEKDVNPSLFLNEFEIPSKAFRQPNVLEQNNVEVGDIIMFKMKDCSKSFLSQIIKIKHDEKIFVTNTSKEDSLKAFAFDRFRITNIEFFEVFKPKNYLMKGE